MIRRDEYEIICQHDPNVPDYMEGGDSASRTGIMALSGSLKDIEVISSFVLDSGLVRHPYQVPWNDSSKTSRDQLVCYIAGLKEANPFLANRLRLMYPNFINYDILMPDVQNHLRLCSGVKGSGIGYAFLLLSILWAAYIKPKDELNQLVCMCIVAGPKYCKLLNSLHPSVEKSLTEYWSGYPFRDQAEVGQALIKKFKESL